MSAQQKKHPFDFKTQYGLGFNQQDDEIIMDFFCGGGGADTGLEMGLGHAVTVAKNTALRYGKHFTKTQQVHVRQQRQADTDGCASQRNDPWRIEKRQDADV